MEAFRNRLKQHAEHVINVGEHCNTEETTKQALILPLLDILGFSPYDPTRVKAEYHADFPGVKASERVDYALFCANTPVMFIEAKAYAESLSNHAPQLARYFNAIPDVTLAAITNGKEWRFFTDLNNKNVMDTSPFLTINFEHPEDESLSQLYRFRYDSFQPDTVRSIAEESVFLTAFKSALGECLREVDVDFVRFLATKANIQRTFTAKFIEGLMPIAKKAVELAISETVVSGLSAKPVDPVPTDKVIGITVDPMADEVDQKNEKVILTRAEKELFANCQAILGMEADIQMKDTESYFTILYQGKTTRWLLRYWGDKKKPVLEFGFPLSPEHEKTIQYAGLEILRENTIHLPASIDIYRVAGLLHDALIFCSDNKNFVRSKKEEAAEILQ